jgi:hypothetical protein
MVRLHSSLKGILARFLPGDAVPILCSSIGRNGSKLLFQSLYRGRARALLGFDRFVGRRLFVEGAWDLKGMRFRHGCLYKTHDLPYDLVASPSLRVVFLFGCPSDSVLSVVRCHETKGAGWVDRHFAHLHADGPYDELLHRDVLRLGEHIDAWRAVGNADVLGLRYETLWDHARVLSDFVGFPVQLPARKVRSFADMSPHTVALARASYEDLDMRVSRLPDYFFSRHHGQSDGILGALDPATASFHRVQEPEQCRN